MNRKTSFDILRILAAFNIVLLHVTSNYMLELTVGNNLYNLTFFINSITRFAVPCFVMISGAIFLSDEYVVMVKRIWTHNILRLVVAYLIWAFVYYAGQSIFLWNYDFWRHGIVRTVTGIAYASDHFWFIFMIIGLYALTPIIKTWICNASKREELYLIILFLVFQILRSTFSNLIDKSLVQQILGITQIIELSGYAGYYVIGHYITKYGLKRITEFIVYGFAIVGVAANYFIPIFQTAVSGTANAGFSDSFGLFTGAETVAIFYAITRYVKPICSEKMTRFITNVSNDTMGVYLMHVLILLIMYHKGVFDKVNPWVGIPVFTIVTFVVCLLVSALLRRIPKIGKYIC